MLTALRRIWPQPRRARLLSLVAVTAYKGNRNKNVTLSQGQTTSFTFNNAGVYKFRCTIHSTLSNGVCSGMCGKVVVS